MEHFEYGLICKRIWKPVLICEFFYKWNIATSYDKRGKQIMLNSSFQLQYDVDFTISLGSNFV